MKSQRALFVTKQEFLDLRYAVKTTVGRNTADEQMIERLKKLLETLEEG